MIQGIIKCSKSFKMRAIDLLLLLAYLYIFEIIIKYFVSQYKNFLLWLHSRRNLTLWLCLISNPVFKYEHIAKVQLNSASIQIAYMWKYWVKFHYCQMVQYDSNKVYEEKINTMFFVLDKKLEFSKQETHGPHRSPEKTVQINWIHLSKVVIIYTNVL